MPSSCYTIRKVIEGLPEKLPCHPDFESYLVGPNDPRPGLHGAWGVRLKADAKFKPAGSLVGTYQGHMLYTHEYDKWKDERQLGKTFNESEMLYDCYAADLKTVRVGEGIMCWLKPLGCMYFHHVYPKLSCSALLRVCIRITTSLCLQLQGPVTIILL